MPPELIERLAALVPPPRRHRMRHYSVLAPDVPLRAAATAMAPGGQAGKLVTERARRAAGIHTERPVSGALPVGRAARAHLLRKSR